MHDQGSILVLNSGSSSVKFAVFQFDSSASMSARRVLHGEIDGSGPAAKVAAWDDTGQLLPGKIPSAFLADAEQATDPRPFFDWLALQSGGQVGAVGHRVVHGGQRFVEPVRITAAILSELDELTPLAPLHQPHNLQPIRLLAQQMPALAQIACFDTAFHASQSPVITTLALPRHLREAGIRRYGFHGLSYEYIARVLPDHLDSQANERVVVAHLGNGASLCALRARASVATTMGFTALDGLVMGTRCGSLDPGVVPYLIDTMGMTAKQVEKLLYTESGLLGLSETSSDMRVLLASDDPRARLAVDIFVSRIVRELGGLVALLGGLDALIFTGGIGEHSSEIRRRICHDMAWLGLATEDAANIGNALRIDAKESAVSVWAIPTNEELMIAEHARTVLALNHT